MTGVLIREAPVTREEFLRQLAAATENRTTEVEGDTVNVDGGRIVIRMTTKERPGEGPPLLICDFTFENMSDEEVRMFMETVDRAAEGIENVMPAAKTRL